MSDTLPVCDPALELHDQLALLQQFLSERANVHPSHALGDPPSGEMDELFRVGDFLFGTTFEGALAILDASESLITRVVSGPSQRTAFIVQSSGKQAAKYLCIFPRGMNSQRKTYYCSCRSFLEKNSRSPILHVCKHLLAIAFLPHLDAKCTTIETLSDEEFGRLVVSRGAPI